MTLEEVTEWLIDKDFKNLGVARLARELLAATYDMPLPEHTGPPPGIRKFVVGKNIHGKRAYTPTYVPADAPQVHHLGVALQHIADEHAAILTPRQINALYQAATHLWNATDDSENGA